MDVPVIHRDELPEVQTSRVGVAMPVLVIEGNLLLEIHALRIGAAGGGIAHSGQCRGEHEEEDGELHGGGLRGNDNDSRLGSK